MQEILMVAVVSVMLAGLVLGCGPDRGGGSDDEENNAVNNGTNNDVSNNGEDLTECERVCLKFRTCGLIPAIFVDTAECIEDCSGEDDGYGYAVECVEAAECNNDVVACTQG